VNRLALHALVVLALATAACSTHADDWAAPRTMNVFSKSGHYFARIVPGNSIGDTFGFAGEKKGKFAIAELFARQPDRSYRLVADVALLNPVAPVDALVSDNGYLVTFDNWHNLGYGKVAAVYGPDGKLVRAYELAELYGAKRLAQIPHSMSSRHWRCAPLYLNPDERSAYTAEVLGGEFVLELATGAIRYFPGQRKECAPPPGPLSVTMPTR
jgi:hypothetical protein